MSDAQAAQGTPATDTAPPAIETVPIANASKADEQPNWLPMRLEQAKRSATGEVLKALGVDNVEAAKAAIDKARAIEEQSKSELQRLNERLAALEPAATKAKSLEERLSRSADAELAKLTEQQRAAVLAIAKDDKTAALDTIEALRPTWAALAAPAVAAPLPAPAKTTAAPAAPPASTTSATTDHRAVYESMKAENPLAAALYLDAHARQIFPDK